MSLARVDPMTLEHIKDWALPIPQREIGAAFIIDEVFYGVDDAHDADTFISISYDLHTEKEARVHIPFKNFRAYLCMLSFNPADGYIYGADNGYHFRYKPSYQ